MIITYSCSLSNTSENIYKKIKSVTKLQESLLMNIQNLTNLESSLHARFNHTTKNAIYCHFPLNMDKNELIGTNQLRAALHQ